MTLDNQTYTGIYRLDSPSADGTPNAKDIQDFSFIRVKLNKKFLFFSLHENWRPISFPPEFKLPKDPQGSLRNYAKSPRFFKLQFKARLNEITSISIPIFLIRMRIVEITEIIYIEELNEDNKNSFSIKSK